MKENTKGDSFCSNAVIKTFTPKQLAKYFEEHKDERWEEITHPYRPLDSDIKYFKINHNQFIQTEVFNDGSMDTGTLYECDINDYFEATREINIGRENLLLNKFFKNFNEENKEEYLLNAYKNLKIEPDNRYKKYKLKEIDEWIKNKFLIELSPQFDNEKTFASLLLIIGEILKSVGLKHTHWNVKEQLFYDKKTKIYIPYLVDDIGNIWNIYELLINNLLWKDHWKTVATSTYNKALKSKQSFEEFNEEWNKNFKLYSVIYSNYHYIKENNL